MINRDELLFTVDENNQPITPVPRHIAHEQGIWHRNAHIWVVNRAGEILCQQRSLKKDSSPGKWETFFGGHLAPGVSGEDGAIAELHEETGISVPPGELELFEVVKIASDMDNEFVSVFLLRWDGDLDDIKLETDEVSQIKWVPLEEVRESYDASDPAWTRKIYTPSLLDWIEGRL